MKLHIFIFVVMLGYYQSLSAVISGTCTTDTDCPANATCRPNACLGLTCLCRQGFVRNIAGTGCFQGALMGDDCDANTFCFGLSSRCNNGKCECIPTYGETAFRTCVPDGYSVFGENCTDECALVSFCNSTTSTCQCKPGYRNLTEEEFWTNENALIDCVANDFDLNFCSGTPVVSTSTSISQTSNDISISETVPPQTISSTAATGSAAESPASSSESIVFSSSSLPLPDSTSSAPAVATPAFSVSLSQLDSRSSTNDIVPSTSSLLTSSAVPTAKVRVNDACARDAECPDNAKCRPRGCLKLNCLCDTGLVANADLTRCLPGAMMGEDCGTNTICFGEQSSSFCNNGKCECGPGFRETTFRTCVLNGYTVFGENCTDECAFVSSCNSSTSTCQCNEGYRSLTEEEFWTNENALIDCVANDFDLNVCSGTPVVSTSTSISLTSTDISISETVPPQTISSTAATIGSAAESSASSSEPIVSSSSSLPLPDSTSSAPIVATPTFSVSLSQLDSRSSTNDIVPSTSSLLTSSVLPTAKVRVNDACARDTECPDNAKCRPRGCLKLNCLCDTGLAANADLTRCLPGAMMGEDCGTNTICFGQQSSSFCNNGKCECRPGNRETAFKTCVPSVFNVFGEPCTSDCAFRSLCNTSTSTCQCNEGYRNLTEEEFWVNQEALIDCVTDTYDLNMCSGTPVVPTSSTSTLDSSSSLFEMTTDPQATSMSSVLDTSLTVNSLAVSSSSTGVVASPSTLDTTTPQELPSLSSFPPESSAESVPISSSTEDPSTQAASLKTSSPISASPSSSSLLVDVTAVDTITPGVSIVLSSGESPSATETILSLDSSTTNLISSSSFQNPTEEQSASGTSSKNPVTSSPLVFSATTSLPFASSSELSQLATQASESLQSVDSVTLDLSSDVFLPSSTVEFTDSSSTVSVLLSSSREVGSSFTASSQTLSTSELQQMSSTSSSSQSSLPASSSFETSTETSNSLQITQQTSSSRQISPLISNSLQATSSSQQISPQISSSPQIAPSISSSSDIASQTASVPQTSPVTSSLKQTASESSISEQISSSASQPSQTSIIQQDSTVQLPSSSNIQTSLSQTSSSLHASPTPDVIDQQVTTITANEVSSSDIQIETTSQLQQSSPSNIESSTPSPEASSPTDVMESSQTAIPSSALTSASLDSSENSSLVVDAQSALSSVPETQSISPTETSALESSSAVVTPVVCQAGSYQASDGTCQACQSGKYSNQPGVSDCTKCELGTYQDVTGQEDCKVCEKGSYQDEDGQIGCKNCKDGYTTTSTKTTDINDCLIECEVGQYRVNKDECAECEVGEYQDTVGSDTCIPCQDDYTTQGKGSTNKSDCYVECQVGQYRINKDKCTECEIGEYQDTVGSDTCIPCQDGFTTQTKGSISDSDCYMVCQPGSYLAPDRTCQACQTGTYSNQPGISDCTKCEQGTYQDVTGQQNCKVCEKGSYQDENGQTACKQCKDGYTTNLTKTTDASDCLIECKVGQYRVNKDECAECEIGEYQDTVGADTCIPCQDGFTTQTNGSTSDSDCYMVCQPGSYQALDRTCKACQAGTYSNQPGVSDCTKCELGTYQNVTGQRDCKMCDKGSYQDEDGQTGCKQCKDGYTTNSSKTSDANSCIIECNVGQYRINKDECTECEIGKYQDTVGTDACIPCQDGFTTQKKGSTAKSDCVNPDAGTSAQNTAGIAASASIAGVLVLIFCGFLLFVCCRRYRAGRLSSSASESTDSTYSMKIPRPMLAYATYTNSSAYKDLAFSNSAYIIDRDRSVV